MTGILEAPLMTAPTVARPYRVLVCDDQPDVLHAMKLLLKGQGYEAVTVNSPRALLREARSGQFDLILADLNYTRDTTSGEEGLDLLAGLESQGNTAPVIVMTAWGSIDLAVEAMRRGACDFVQKPWDNERVLAAIRKQAASERGRRSELEIAAAVQQKLFPRSAPRLRTIDYAGHCVAAQGVGGDYYDFLDLGENLGFVLADVSGKGVPAALLMANLQACFRTQAASGVQRPAELSAAVHRHFYSSTGSDRFATLFFGSYDDRTRRMRYVNCGHCAPLHLRSGGELRKLEPTGAVLGAFEEWNCAEDEISLDAGDTLLLYSDGVTEATNSSGDEFGEYRLARLLRERRSRTADDLVRDVVNAVAAYSGGSRMDDITVVAIRGIP
ncbi:MAG TPA: SpoIIE family protein phosphatase [Bryobacteraceae bacterium]|jgi:sigma-B regulation protein RsbU (phosphoserine phosphatase)|nr:SpoIIE family protein phosphatase [Bryobacteraceae bacterium]